MYIYININISINVYKYICIRMFFVINESLVNDDKGRLVNQSFEICLYFL